MTEIFKNISIKISTDNYYKTIYGPVKNESSSCMVPLQKKKKKKKKIEKRFVKCQRVQVEEIKGDFLLKTGYYTLFTLLTLFLLNNCELSFSITR